MLHQRRIIGSLAGIGFLLGIASGVGAAEMPLNHSVSQGFERLEQPLAVKVGVVAGGLCLIGLELWWFLFSQPKAK